MIAAARMRLRPPDSLSTITWGLFVAFLVGTLAAFNAWYVGLALIVMIAAPVYIFSQPEKAALGMIAILPFLIAPIHAGEFAVFAGIPFGLMIGVALLLRCRGAVDWRHPHLLSLGVVLLVAVMIASTINSADPLRGASRCVSVTVFATFAAGLGTAVSSGRITRLSIIRAFTISASLAAIALIGQSLAQFVFSEGRVLQWLGDARPWFAGLSGPGRNWRSEGVDLVRALFPFMAPASAGQYMAMGMIPATWLAVVGGRTRDERSWAIVGLSLMTVALLLTFSRQAWIGALVAMFVVMIYLRRGILLALAVPFLAALAIVPVPTSSQTFADQIIHSREERSASERVDFWSSAIDYTQSRPVLGIGPGQYQSLGPDPTHAYYAHNVYLDEFVELGVAGGVIFIVMTLSYLSFAWRRQSPVALGMLLAFAVSNFFDDVFYFPRNGFALAVAIALLARVERAPPAAAPHERTWQAEPMPVREPALTRA